MNKREKMRRQGTMNVGHDVNAFAPLLPDRRRPPAGPSKAAMAAEAAALTAGMAVTVLPTVRVLRCLCGHQGKATHQRGAHPTFRCGKCGAKL